MKEVTIEIGFGNSPTPEEIHEVLYQAGWHWLIGDMDYEQVRKVVNGAVVKLVGENRVIGDCICRKGKYSIVEYDEVTDGTKTIPCFIYRIPFSSFARTVPLKGIELSGFQANISVLKQMLTLKEEGIEIPEEEQKLLDLIRERAEAAKSDQGQDKAEDKGKDKAKDKVKTDAVPDAKEAPEQSDTSGEPIKKRKDAWKYFLVDACKYYSMYSGMSDEELLKELRTMSGKKRKKLAEKLEKEFESLLEQQRKAHEEYDKWIKWLTATLNELNGDEPKSESEPEPKSAPASKPKPASSTPDPKVENKPEPEPAEPVDPPRRKLSSDDDYYCRRNLRDVKRLIDTATNAGDHVAMSRYLLSMQTALEDGDIRTYKQLLEKYKHYLDSLGPAGQQDSPTDQGANPQGNNSPESTDTPSSDDPDPSGTSDELPGKVIQAWLDALKIEAPPELEALLSIDDYRLSVKEVNRILEESDCGRIPV